MIRKLRNMYNYYNIIIHHYKLFNKVGKLFGVKLTDRLRYNLYFLKYSTYELVDKGDTTSLSKLSSKSRYWITYYLVNNINLDTYNCILLLCNLLVIHDLDYKVMMTALRNLQMTEDFINDEYYHYYIDNLLEFISDNYFTIMRIVNKVKY